MDSHVGDEVEYCCDRLGSDDTTFYPRARISLLRVLLEDFDWVVMYALKLCGYVCIYDAYE